jgi:tetratricopeptide (TPR) repeat protein
MLFMKKVLSLILLFALAGSACVTTKKKGDVGKGKKFYHNLTSKYNYWFNADELLRLSVAKLNEQHKDNYNVLLPLFPYMKVDAQSVTADLDNVIKKASTAVSLHRVGDWTDDCYVLTGQGYFLKRDYEGAEAIFKYVDENFNPAKNKNKLKAEAKKKKVDSKKKKKKKPSKRKKKRIAKQKAKERAEARKKAKELGLKPGEKLPETPSANQKKPGQAPKKDPKPTEPLGFANDPYERGLRKRRAAYPQAMVWYVRTLTHRDKYEEADFLLRNLAQDRWFSQQERKDLAVAETELWLKQEDYSRAIEPLTRAIPLTRKKQERARLSFILGQLLERAGKHEESYAALETVLRSGASYEMTFNARLLQTKAGWANGRLKSQEAIRDLERLAKDTKNADYTDQIYYVLGEIALADGQKKEAITYLRKSLQTNKTNTSQRVESYIKLAELYFETEDFVQAKNYYDSTMTVLTATDPRYQTVSNYATNLTDIARLITAIEANDSIIRVYRMTPEERRDLAKKIKKQRDDEADRLAAAERAAAAAAAKTKAGGTDAGAGRNTPVAGVKDLNFYFYNEGLVKRGRRDFERAWGPRKSEDNWRRSQRIKTDGTDVAAIDTTQAKANEAQALDDIFKGLPANDAELQVLNIATYEAMYNLGTQFRDKIQHNNRCISTLEEMQTRYPTEAKYEKETWYYCYLAHKELGNQPRAKYYYDRLVGKYPNSPFARTLSDPNFLAQNRERERELLTYYEQTFQSYQNGDYRTAFDRCTEAPVKYGSANPLMPKFLLLSAQCVGSLQGTESYCQALSDVIGRYPESAEATRAKEVARVIGCKGFEAADPASTSGSTTPIENIDDAFVLENDKLHYLLVALNNGADIRLDEVKAAMIDYNREFHKLEALRISNITLGSDANTPILVVRKFDNKEQAMRYYREVTEKPEFMGEKGKKTYQKEFFVVTQENYRRVLKNKTLNGYREFFMNNYLD